MPATIIYAFARDARDLARSDGGGVDGVAELRERVAKAYRRGEAQTPGAPRAFATLVRSYDVPRVLVDAYVEGLCWGLEGRRHATFEQLLDRAARLGSSLTLMGVLFMHDRARDVLPYDLLARAADLGIAMALTSVARDVGGDAARGRLLLPIEWLEEEGVDVDAWIAHPEASAGVRRATARLLDAAETYYTHAEPGLAAVPFDCRTPLRAMARIHAAQAKPIEAAGYDSITARLRVSAPAKARIAFASLTAGAGESLRASRPPPPAAKFLIDALLHR